MVQTVAHNSDNLALSRVSMALMLIIWSVHVILSACLVTERHHYPSFSGELFAATFLLSHLLSTGLTIHYLCRHTTRPWRIPEPLSAVMSLGILAVWIGYMTLLNPVPAIAGETLLERAAHSGVTPLTLGLVGLLALLGAKPATYKLPWVGMLSLGVAAQSDILFTATSGPLVALVCVHTFAQTASLCLVRPTLNPFFQPEKM